VEDQKKHLKKIEEKSKKRIKYISRNIYNNNIKNMNKFNTNKKGCGCGKK